MAKTPDQIKKELEQISKLYADLGKTNPFRGVDPEKISASKEETQKLADALFGVREQVDRINQSFDSLYTQLKNTTAEIGKVKTPAQEMESAFKGSLKEVKKLVDEERGLGDLSIKELKTLQKRAATKKSDAEAAAKSLVRETGLMDSLKKTTKGYVDKRREDYRNLSDAEKTAIGLLEKRDTTLDDINKKIERRIQKEKEINKGLGLGGNIIKGVGKALDKIGMGGLASQLGLEDAQKEMQGVSKKLVEANEKIEDGKDKMSDFTIKSKVLHAGFDSMRKSLAKNLTDPLSIGLFLFNGLFKAAQKVDKQTGELAKNLNMSYGDGLKLQNELTTAANSAGGLSVSGKALGNSLMAVNKELGISNTNIDDNLLLFTKLHKSSGLTYEELQGINAITNATGGDLEKNTKEVMAQARLTGQRFKVALNEKDILKDISNVSKATTISLGKNPALIAQAVSTAKALGLELSKVEGVADSLLNFEESISKELQAELLLGKDINLEKAREAALNNDLATVAEEIAQQAGNAAEFAEMNRIQQQALADAVGLSREELANSLFIQEQIGNLTGEEYELRKAQIEKLEAKGLSQAQIKEKLGKESINDLKAQNSISEQIAKSTDKLNDAFAGIAIPLMQIITPIIELLIPAIQSIAFILTPVFDMFNGIAGILTGSISDLGTMETILGSIALIAAGYYATTKGIAMYNGFIQGYKIAQVALERANKAGILGTIGALTVQLGIQLGLLSASLATNAAVTFGVGVAIAVAAAAAGYAAIKAITKGNDVYSPGSNSSGYGNRTLLGPEGAIALNNKDTVIAGTKLFDKGDDVISKGAGEVQMPTQDNRTGERTNTLLETLIGQNAKKPELSPVNMYEIQ